jgi:hypothetical protein
MNLLVEGEQRKNMFDGTILASGVFLGKVEAHDRYFRSGKMW